MSVIFRTKEYNAEGELVASSQGFMPKFLDWMPIAAKAFWIRALGSGNPDTEYVLLESQGEQRLLVGVSLAKLDLKQHMEKLNGAEQSTIDFIDREGIVCTPGNQ